MCREPKPYEIYRHFKGNLYQIVAIALDSEDGSKQVVYQQLYSPFLVYVRPYDMFISEVDHIKYPQVTQKYRFERVKFGGNAEAYSDIPEQSNIMAEDVVQSENNRMESTQPGNSPFECVEPKEDIEETLNPKLLDFLDASTYAERLRILDSMKSEITHEIINTISAALELKVQDGDLHHRYEDLRDCLAVFEKYECNRLR